MRSLLMAWLNGYDKMGIKRWKNMYKNIYKNIYKKRTASLLLALTLIMMPVINVMAQETEEEISKEDITKESVITIEDANATLESYDSGESEWKEIHIKSVNDFRIFSRNCRLDTWSQDKKVYLECDLDLTDGDFTSIPTFGGYFDGQGHTISGLEIRDSVSYTGLFCYTQKSAVIANLNVKGAVRPAGKQVVVGGIAGDNRGIIINSSFDGIIEGNDYVGGITGYNEPSGILIKCRTDGRIKGAHYTGGIAGDNMGNIFGCVNEADVNIYNSDTAMSIEDINIEQYTMGFLNTENDKETDKENNKQESINNNTIDSGGIAGLSTGIIQSCVNNGTVGYEHVGYNIGGIVGRQSGYVYGCENSGTVYGRKDVGGIAGQTEPYIAIDLTQDIAYQLSENIDKLHDITSRMIEDAGSESDIISGRLSIIQAFADNALDDMSFLSDETIVWADNMTGSVNDAINRIDYIIDESAKENGMADETAEAAGNIKNAASELDDTVATLDVYQYMTPEEKANYDDAKQKMKDGEKVYTEAYSDAVKAHKNMYIDELRGQGDYTGGEPNEDDLRPVIGGEVQKEWSYSSNFEDYLEVEDWVHYDADTDTAGSFPALGTKREELDNNLLSDVADKMSDNASDIDDESYDYADKKYRESCGDSYSGHGYSQDMKDYLNTMSEIVMRHQDDMTEAASKELEQAVGYAKDAAQNLENAGNEAKSIVKNLEDMPDINMPQFGNDYRSKMSSLNLNLQGLSENMGYLNSEMSSTNDVLLDDMAQLNDQFSVIMRLYTDALDGVLEMDYSNIYEDNSREDAETSTEATVAGCKNSGTVEGDINVSGIAGTMAIEYDFDLESDVTGIEDAKLNSTFLTKCVLRSNVNTGRITAQKSCVGGISGLQEMGTILWCENYGKIISSSGNYAGGIAGQSRSHIMRSFAKCSLEGEEYVAGIAGSGYSISNCYTMVRIKKAAAFSGAIAGEIDESGNVENNFFVSDEIAGIDRISYSGKAEPVSYAQLMEMEIENLPDKFRTMRIVFYADDEEISSVECSYGGAVSSVMYPNIPVKEGFYADWDIKELNHVVQDEDVTVEYVRYLTTIASKQTRGNSQSVFLVDGKFEKDAQLEIKEIDVNELETGEDVPVDAVEGWNINFTDDGNNEHQIRYQAPRGQTEGVNVYVKRDGEWIKEDTELMGIYHLFTVAGTEAEIAACVHEKTIADYLVYIIPAAAVVIVAAIIIVSRKKRKRRRKEGKG
ncbi:MAG: hypothetical protein NC313_08570 [Butyrivibrio sp.]|nr:hypothetical protein [Butyrivibrio sp.]